MKPTKSLLFTLTTSTIFLSGAAFSASQNTTQASTPPAQASASASTVVTPHNHMRDSKGIYVAPKASASASASASANASKGVTAHNHMRDAKGIYVAPKKTDQPASAKASASEK